MKKTQKRWYSLWPSVTPKSFEVEKAASEFIREWASMIPQGAALGFYGKEISYKELNEAIDRFANGLQALGVKKGSRVALQMQNCPQFIISFFGTLRAGCVVVSLNPMFKHAELEYEINDASPEVLVSLDYLYPEIEKIGELVSVRHTIITSLSDYLPENPALPLPPEAKEPKRSVAGTLDFMEFLDKADGRPVCVVNDLRSDLALLQYTGGTTGLPKGAMLTHYSVSLCGLGAAYWYRLREGDVTLAALPLFHVFGMNVAMCGSLMSGGHLVLLSRFSPEATAKAIDQYRCNFWPSAPTMITALLELPDVANYDFDSLRVAVSGGAPISAETQRKFKELIPNAFVGEGYGLTEANAHAGFFAPVYLLKPGFVGIPMISEVKIVDLETAKRELPPNEEGQIVIKSPTIMKGYWKKPEETKKVLKDGWLYTGDIGLMDEDGYIKVSGRKKELILCSGFNVFPSEVEGLLYRHPAIAEAAVIGIPDSYRGETPKAFVVLKGGYKGKVSEQEIIDWCKENMSAYKRPRVVEFRDDLPKSAAGKILRRVLTEQENTQEGGQRKGSN
jgi:long-chain acyl-CoA synthetase